MRLLHLTLSSFLLLQLCNAANVAAADDLLIADKGTTSARVLVSPTAGAWEKRAAADLVHYIRQMSGAEPKLVSAADDIAASLKAESPLLIVGQAALDAEPSLKTALAKVAKPDPVLRADAIVIRRSGNRVYLAGANDDCHYYAVAELLRRWGCRWYLPGDIGECIPHAQTLKVSRLDVAYAPPFEVRKYWISWNGDTTGKPEFMHRNFFNDIGVPSGHAIGKYTKSLIPPGKTMFNVPISEDKTAETVARQILPQFAAGKDVSLGMEDGVYQSDSPKDKELIALQFDKYFMTQSYTDAFMVFYNKTAEILMREAPQSRAHLGFLAYSNITLPPILETKAAKPLVAYLAPIDIDPNHAMTGPRSAPKREYRDMLAKWAKVMDGRLVIYDYDQSMLVWRDVPNPSHHVFRQDVKQYRDAKILGVDTESRGALATTFLNLYFRGQLLWNPDADVDALLAEFYEKFYGPAAGPMRQYWTAIYKAWEQTLVTEHEYFVIPAIYTPELIEQLRTNIAEADAAMKPLTKSARTPEGITLMGRMELAQMSFQILEKYIAMTRAANAEVDYPAAVAAGQDALAVRNALTDVAGTFTTYVRIGEHGYAWWPGEVKQYRELIPLIDGTKGKLAAKLPLVWNFRRDPKDQGVKEGWQKQPADLSWWNTLKQPVSVEDRQKSDGRWEQLRTDLYAQAQGVVTSDFQSYAGHAWYQTDIELSADQVAGRLHLHFPGLFNECWLYVNGEEAGHRPFKGLWWLNDYRFEWDADVSGKLKPGKNSIALRIFNPHHMGGMFRRPFLYWEVQK